VLRYVADANVSANSLPTWLEYFSALGSGLAGAAAIAALLLWQGQKRAQRRSDVAEQALVALHLFSEELGLLCHTLVARADEDLDEDSITEDYLSEYARYVTRPAAEFRRNCERELRALEHAAVRAKAVLAPHEASVVREPLDLYASVRRAVVSHTSRIEQGGWSLEALAAFRPVRDAEQSLKDIRSRADMLLQPIARYELLGGSRWQRQGANLERDFGQDLVLPPEGPSGEL
jgi:hypothetical protein